MVLYQRFLQDCCTVCCGCFLVELSSCKFDSTCTSRTDSRILQILPGHVSGNRSISTASQPYIASLNLGAALSTSNSALHRPFKGS